MSVDYPRCELSFPRGGRYVEVYLERRHQLGGLEERQGGDLIDDAVDLGVGAGGVEAAGDKGGANHRGAQGTCAGAGDEGHCAEWVATDGGGVVKVVGGVLCEAAVGLAGGGWTFFVLWNWRVTLTSCGVEFLVVVVKCGGGGVAHATCGTGQWADPTTRR